MAMASHNKNTRFNPTTRNDGGSFQEHDKDMRKFRSSHVDVAMVNAPGCDEIALLEGMRPLRIHYAMMETGGLKLLGSTTDWSALVPVFRVARYKLSQN